MKATEQYFPVVLFIMLYNVVLSFHCVDEIKVCTIPTTRRGISCGVEIEPLVALDSCSESLQTRKADTFTSTFKLNRDVNFNSAKHPIWSSVNHEYRLFNSPSFLKSVSVRCGISSSPLRRRGVKIIFPFIPGLSSFHLQA